ncbi:MAG: hypothetical protein R3D33_08585 [Hyphomicrobiaceae bacterium]
MLDDHEVGRDAIVERDERLPPPGEEEFVDRLALGVEKQLERGVGRPDRLELHELRPAEPDARDRRTPGATVTAKPLRASPRAMAAARLK